MSILVQIPLSKYAIADCVRFSWVSKPHLFPPSFLSSTDWLTEYFLQSLSQMNSLTTSSSSSPSKTFFIFDSLLLLTHSLARCVDSILPTLLNSHLSLLHTEYYCTVHILPNCVLCFSVFPYRIQNTPEAYNRVLNPRLSSGLVVRDTVWYSLLLVGVFVSC